VSMFPEAEKILQPSIGPPKMSPAAGPMRLNRCTVET
jgi:hypothetical protein